jgi:hypothetical protein
MPRRILAVLTCAAACSAAVRPRPAEQVERVERLAPPAAVADTVPERHAEPGLDLSGYWATGSTNEPAVPKVVLQLRCNYTPPLWTIQQRGDTVLAWALPEHHAQGMMTRRQVSPVPAEGRIAGVDVTMRLGDTRYVLRYDASSGHLRGTLNGAPFWAVRQQLERRTDCIPVP